LILVKTFKFIENIFATTSSFLADIQSGFLIPSSKSTTKLSGTTFNISLFGISTPHFALSKALSISSSDTSEPVTETIPLFLITSKLDELNEIYAQFTCSHAIFSASSKDASKLFLNSSISSIFHFLIAVEFDIQTHNILKSSFLSLSKYQITVLILELHISIVVIVLDAHILICKLKIILFKKIIRL
jgi:hypothetical protein